MMRAISSILLLMICSTTLGASNETSPDDKPITATRGIYQEATDCILDYAKSFYKFAAPEEIGIGVLDFCRNVTYKYTDALEAEINANKDAVHAPSEYKKQAIEKGSLVFEEYMRRKAVNTAIQLKAGLNPKPQKR